MNSKDIYKTRIKKYADTGSSCRVTFSTLKYIDVAPLIKHSSAFCK